MGLIMQCLLNHLFKALRKAPGGLFGTFGWAFQVMLAAATGFLGQVTIHQQPVDIIVREPFPALMDGPRAFAQGQSRNAVILGDHDVATLAEIDQGNIHRVSPSADHLDLAVF